MGRGRKGVEGWMDRKGKREDKKKKKREGKTMKMKKNQQEDSTQQPLPPTSNSIYCCPQGHTGRQADRRRERETAQRHRRQGSG